MDDSTNNEPLLNDTFTQQQRSNVVTSQTSQRSLDRSASLLERIQLQRQRESNASQVTSPVSIIMPDPSGVVQNIPQLL